MFTRKKNILKALHLIIKDLNPRELRYNQKIELAMKAQEILEKFDIDEPFTIISNELIVKRFKNKLFYKLWQNEAMRCLYGK
jgi:hypothetical protein